MKLDFSKSVVLRGLASTFIKGFGAIFNYLLTFLIAMKFGAEGNGIFALFMSIVVICSSILYFGFDTFLVREFSTYDEGFKKKQNALYSFVFIRFFSNLLFLSILVSLTAFAFGKQLYGIISFSIFLNIFIDINAAVLRGIKQAEWYSYFTQMGKNLTLLILMLFFSFDTENTSIILWLYLLGLLINAILIFRIVRSKTGYPISRELMLEFNFKIRDVFLSTKDFWLSSTLVFSMLWVDFIVIDFFLGKTESGIYSVALKLANLVTFAFMAFNAFLAPKISEEFNQGNLRGLQKLISLNFIAVFPMLLIPFLLILLFPTTLLSFFGEEFVDGKMILILLATAQFINGILGPVSIILQMTGYQRVFQRVLTWVFFLKLIAIMLLVKEFGLFGVAVATFSSIVLWTVIGSYLVRRKLKIYSRYNNLI